MTFHVVKSRARGCVPVIPGTAHSTSTRMSDQSNDQPSFDPTSWSAADALETARHARARVAERAATPGWYPPVYGLGVGGMVASLALPGALAAWGLLLCIVLLLGAYRRWQRQSGLSVSGYRAGETRRIALRLAVLQVVAFTFAIWSRLAVTGAWSTLVPLVGGAVVAILAARASLAWDRAWRTELLDPEAYSQAGERRTARHEAQS